MENLSSHRLHAMFEAKSIAIVGASARENSFGQRLVEAIHTPDIQAKISYINPAYTTINGQPCLASLRELDTPPDLCILGVGAKNLEQSLLDAIAVGAKSAVIYDSCYGLTQDGKTPLLQRLRELALEHGIAVCGGNCMGFINVTDKRIGTYYPLTTELKAGGISLIAQSGSVFTVLALSDRRYHYDLIISPGQEIGVSIEEYIEYALLRPTTQVITVFMEGCRQPQKLQQVLAQAQLRQIPIIICKVAKTAESKAMAQSHTGAIAGSETAYEALFERYGVISVDSVDQMMNTALLFSQGRIPSQGGVAMMTDSGGLRELIVDRAAMLKVPLAKITPKLEQQLTQFLPPSLTATNPLDCLDALTDDYHTIYENAFTTFSESDEVAILGLEADLRDDYIYVDALLELSRRLSKITTKPCFFYSNFSQANNRQLAAEFADLNLPVLNGTEDMLMAVKHMLSWRDHMNQSAVLTKETCPPSPKLIEKWQQQLSHDRTSTLDEAMSLSLLSDFLIPTITHQICENWQQLQHSAPEHTYPVVLKTANPEIQHKSDQGGVVLNIQNQAELQQAYEQLSARLGKRVIMQPMVQRDNGIELTFGCVVDEDFGAVVMISAGGVLVEILEDRQFALAPFNVEMAQCIIEKLSINRLLNGYRGKPAIDKQALAKAFSQFSIMCDALKEHYKEIDVNPILADKNGVVALDALVIK